MKESTIQEAYDLVVLKWERIIRRLELNEQLPIFAVREVINMEEFICFIGGCAYCGLFRVKQCEDCPLNINEENCLNPNHPYSKFTTAVKYDDIENSLKYAIELLNLIRETKPKDI